MQRAPFYFEGSIENNGEFNCTYIHNSKKKTTTFNLFDLDNDKSIEFDLKLYKPFKEHFLIKLEDGTYKLRKSVSQVGSIMFFYYGFDLTDKASFSRDDIAKLRQSSVYLFRDNVRVFPYGEIGDDWLGFSKLRGQIRTSEIFSYNDLIGYVFITQSENPLLRDAANREGLMNVNGCRDDFIALVSTSIKVMKYYVDIDKQIKKNEKEKASNRAKKDLNIAFEDLTKTLKSDKTDKKVIVEKANEFVRASNKLVKQKEQELLITTELAGTGMAVEKATHDTMVLLTKIKENTNALVKKVDTDKVGKIELLEFLNDLAESLEFIYQQLTVLSPLLRKARQYVKDVSLKDVASRVKKFFLKDLSKNIEFKITGNDFIIRTNTGLILQVLINLIDNSIYWIKQLNPEKKIIQLHLDRDTKSFTFSDNGPGISDEKSDIIFNEFYSTKSDGRGLGLYIVRELLDRIDAEIFVSDKKILKGANITVKFK